MERWGGKSNDRHFSVFLFVFFMASGWHEWLLHTKNYISTRNFCTANDLYPSRGFPWVFPESETTILKLKIVNFKLIFVFLSKKSSFYERIFYHLRFAASVLWCFWAQRVLLFCNFSTVRLISISFFAEKNTNSGFLDIFS